MKNIAIGIDLGGTNTVFGIVDENGNCIKKNTISTTKYETPELLVEASCNQLQKMLLSLNSDYTLTGIGIGAPNGNYFKGTIEFAPNLKWKRIINLVDLFKKYYNIPIYLTNDANAAAIGEMIYGVAKNVNDFIIVTLGTGVGSGFVANGSIIYGNDGFAGELGHIIVDIEGRECGCGRKGCLETYASATGIVKTAKSFLEASHEDSLLKKIPDNKITSKMITEVAQKGDQLALKIFDYTAQKLGFSLANAVAISSPKMIVLFGGLAKAGKLIIEPTKKYMEQYLLNIYKNKIPIVMSSLINENAAILGASALVWNELNKR